MASSEQNNNTKNLYTSNTESSKKSSASEKQKYELKVSIPLESLGGYVPRTPPPNRSSNFYNKSNQTQDPWGKQK